MAFIRLADLIVNINCIAAVKYSTYNGFGNGKEIPIVNICLRIPEGSLDGETEECCLNCQGVETSDDEGQPCCLNCQGVEKLEYENEMAIAIWNYFTQSSEVTVLFE